MADTGEDIRAYLIAEGIGTSATVKTRFMQEKPDYLIVIYGTGGSPPTLALGADRIAERNPSLQIVVRGVPDDHDTPFDTAASIIAKMAEIQTEAINGTTYHFANPLQSEPIPIGKDENRRFRVSCNFMLSKD